MRILIIEPHASGHHANYLHWLVRATNRRQWSVVIATNAATLTHPSITGLSSEFENVQIHLMSASNSANRVAARSPLLIRKEFAYWRGFREVVDEVRASMSIDAVILPYIDYCFHAVAILGSPFKELPWCGISMRLAVPKSDANVKSALPWKWRLAKRVLRGPNLKALFVINPSVRDIPTNWCAATLLAKLRYLPDPAEQKINGSRKESRAILGLCDGDVAILVFGLIDERKGIDSLLANLSSQNNLSNYVVILAGKQSAYMHNQMQTSLCVDLLSRKRLIVLDRFLTDAEQSLVFTASDVVWVGYRNHFYMSGVLVLAGRAGLPVIGTTEGEIGRLITEHNLGAVARMDRSAEVTLALRAMLDARRRNQMGRRAELAFASHTVENFGASVMAAFQSSCNA